MPLEREFIPQPKHPKSSMSPLPNSLTILRVALVPAFVAALFWRNDAGLWTAFVLFVLAGATDAVDGLVARKLDAESEFGKMLDPIADKMMVAAALFMLVADGIVHGLHLIPAIVILCREILVSGLREFLAGADVSLPVTRVAKGKTALQMVAIGALILSPILNRWLPGTWQWQLAGLWSAAAIRSPPASSISRPGSTIRGASAPPGLPRARRGASHEAPLFRLGAAEGGRGRRDVRAARRHEIRSDLIVALRARGRTMRRRLPIRRACAWR